MDKPAARDALAKVQKGLKAYDMEMLLRFVDQADNKGWVFGLPPGISPTQWPLDPISGYPLMHGFTLLLPEDDRVRGPDLVALSFFATAADQNDGSAGQFSGSSIETHGDGNITVERNVEPGEEIPGGLKRFRISAYEN